MHEPTRFGDFLLLKKLSEDPIGETYRAGRLEGTAVEELVFLRTFGVAGANATELAALLAAAAGRRIQGPGLTYAVGSGEVGGVAYAVYEHTIGWDLPQLLEMLSSGFSDLELDHALLIVERLAKGLAVVHQTDAAAARPCHGFFVPQNVRLTSEGEIDLMGFEAAPYLTRLAAGGGLGELHPYLSPETRAGEAPTPAADVYSLGAILWRLLLGQPPPLAAELGLGADLAAAKTSGGEALPAGLAELLQTSLASPIVRPAHAGLWHKQLSDWMGRNEVKTTHFDLAFAIHELFRRQIQSEQGEIDRERRLDLSPTPAEPAVAEPPHALPRADVAETRRPGALSAQRPEDSASVTAVTPPPRRSRAPLYGGLAALVIAAAIGGWLAFRGSPAPPPAPPPVQAAPPPSPPPSDALQVAQLEIERLVQEQAQAMNEQLAEEYNEQIRSLREQLQAAEEAENQAIQEALEAAKTPPTPAATPEAPPSTEAAAEGSKPANATPAAASPPAASPPAASPPAVSPPAAAAPAEPVAGESAAESAAVDLSPPPAVAPPPPRETVSLPPPPVQAAPPPPPRQPVVTPPERLRMPEPRYPNRARQYRKEATVLLKVLVDADGKVIEAQPVIDKPDPYGFYVEAMRAARGAEFKPATTDGVPTRMWTTVVISFKRN